MIASTKRRLALCGLTAIGLAMAAPTISAAQNVAYENPGYSGYDSDYSDSVTVIAPRHQNHDAATGAPEERMFASRVVDYSDLDLSTRWGADELRGRIEAAARSACGELNFEFPVAAPDNRSCFGRAVRGAMRQTPIAYMAQPTSYHDQYEDLDGGGTQ